MWWKILIGMATALVIAFLILLSQVNVTPGIITHSLFGGGSSIKEATMQSRLKAPEGFSVGLYAQGVANARFIEFSHAGDLVVAQPRESTLTLIRRDENGDGIGDGLVTLMDNLNRPHSVDFHGDYLYVGESTAVGRIRFDHEQGRTIGEYERIITGLGDAGNHWSKTIRFGPDGFLYLSSGSTCNVCLEEDSQRAAITRYNPDGSGEERFATGLRNAVGFDWSPFDNAMYATDNGRDLLGDDYPPCELNLVEAGKFYGWPYVNGFGEPDPDFGDDAMPAQATSPVHGFRAHNAPLGIRFINVDAFPSDYDGAALVALHGSWNKSSHDGYKVVSLHRNDAGFEERDFLSGFEEDGHVIGRPVDVAAGPDNCVYVSDDFGMAIYRICHGEAQVITQTQAAAGPAQTGLESIDQARLRRLRARGEQIYKTRGCVACHVVSTGEAPFGLLPIKNVAAKYNTESLANFYKTPKPPMPPVRLSDEAEELALSAYLLGL